MHRKLTWNGLYKSFKAESQVKCDVRFNDLTTELDSL